MKKLLSVTLVLLITFCYAASAAASSFNLPQGAKFGMTKEEVKSIAFADVKYYEYTDGLDHTHYGIPLAGNGIYTTITGYPDMICGNTKIGDYSFRMSYSFDNSGKLNSVIFVDEHTGILSIYHEYDKKEDADLYNALKGKYGEPYVSGYKNFITIDTEALSGHTEHDNCANHVKSAPNYRVLISKSIDNKAACQWFVDTGEYYVLIEYIVVEWNYSYKDYFYSKANPSNVKETQANYLISYSIVTYDELTSYEKKLEKQVEEEENKANALKDFF